MGKELLWREETGAHQETEIHKSPASPRGTHPASRLCRHLTRCPERNMPEGTHALEDLFGRQDTPGADKSINTAHLLPRTGLMVTSTHGAWESLLREAVPQQDLKGVPERGIKWLILNLQVWMWSEREREAVFSFLVKGVLKEPGREKQNDVRICSE